MSRFRRPFWLWPPEAISEAVVQYRYRGTTLSCYAGVEWRRGRWRYNTREWDRWSSALTAHVSGACITELGAAIACAAASGLDPSSPSSGQIGCQRPIDGAAPPRTQLSAACNGFGTPPSYEIS